MAVVLEVSRRAGEDKADDAKVERKRYSFILDKDYRWESWAASKGKDDKLDHNKTLTGNDLTEFVNLKLFPYLHSVKQKASGPDTIEYKIGEISARLRTRSTAATTCARSKTRRAERVEKVAAARSL